MAQNQLMSQSIADLHTLDSTAAIRLKNVMLFAPDSMRKTMDKAMTNLPMNDRIMSWKVAYSLGKIADTYRELGTSSADWSPALTWAARSIDLFRTHESLHTYAQLLKKLGRTDEAISAQKEAIREAGRVGWETDEYENELAEMGQK